MCVLKQEVDASTFLVTTCAEEPKLHSRILLLQLCHFQPDVLHSTSSKVQIPVGVPPHIQISSKIATFCQHCASETKHGCCDLHNTDSEAT